MKAISLWQPWASAMALGLKKNETRHWGTAYRGPLLIHAAKKKINISDNYYLLKNLRKHGLNPHEMPYGALICMVYLVGCEQIGYENCPACDSLEYLLGNYDHGRFMWITDNLKIFDPIPYKGSQGFFNVSDYPNNEKLAQQVMEFINPPEQAGERGSDVK